MDKLIFMCDRVPKISIIIPLYNAEKYIKNCIQSIKEQTYINWNAIIIDDGSKDNSLEQCKGAIDNDQRFQLLSQENNGVSITRNRALDLCKGEYVLFLDADDYLLEKNALGNIVAKMQGGDLDFIRFEYKGVNECNETLFTNKSKYLKRRYFNKVISPDEYVNKVALDEFFLCLSFFRNSIIQEHNIRFIPKCRMREDADFTIRYLSYCTHVMYIPDELYAYRKHEGAATSCDYRKYEADIKLVFDSLYSFYQGMNNGEFKNCLSQFLSSLMVNQKNSKYANYYLSIVDALPVKSNVYIASKKGWLGNACLGCLDVIKKIRILINWTRC